MKREKKLVKIIIIQLIRLYFKFTLDDIYTDRFKKAFSFYTSLRIFYKDAINEINISFLLTYLFVFDELIAQISLLRNIGIGIGCSGARQFLAAKEKYIDDSSRSIYQKQKDPIDF